MIPDIGPLISITAKGGRKRRTPVVERAAESLPHKGAIRE